MPCDRYDAVIEIGANVGVYSVFFDALINANPKARLKKIVCFEPALEPFIRLTENLRVNATKHVSAFRAAISDTRGFQTFFEPSGHLTNGSFIEDFAKQFSGEIAQTVVSTHHADELEIFFKHHRKVLIKIDVEGFEPQLLKSLSPLIERYSPDLLVEVLTATAGDLNQVVNLAAYKKYLISAQGLKSEPILRGDERYRDWLLTPREVLMSAAELGA